MCNNNKNTRYYFWVFTLLFAIESVLNVVRVSRYQWKTYFGSNVYIYNKKTHYFPSMPPVMIFVQNPKTPRWFFWTPVLRNHSIILYSEQVAVHVNNIAYKSSLSLYYVNVFFILYDLMKKYVDLGLFQ